MSYSYDRRTDRRVYNNLPGPSNRTALGYWIPLIVIGAGAVAGVAAWIWSERKDSEHDDNVDYGSSSDAEYAQRLARQRKDMRNLDDTSLEARTVVDEYGNTVVIRESDETFLSRVGGIYRRTPSPQQLYDGASKRLAAGMAVVGRGLQSIQEEQRSRDDYHDHERWSEEAESREVEQSGSITATAAGAAAGILGAGAALVGLGPKGTSPAAQSPRAPKRTVAIVVSADNASTFSPDADDSSYHIEHAVSQADT